MQDQVVPVEEPWGFMLMDGSDTGASQLSLELRDHPLQIHAVKLLDKKVLIVDVNVGGRRFEVRVSLRHQLGDRRGAQYLDAIESAVRARLDDAVKVLSARR